MNFTQHAVDNLQQRRPAPLTPLIDVVFLLLIFLLFGDFSHQEGRVSSRIEPTDTAAGTTTRAKMRMTLRQENGAASVSMQQADASRALLATGLDQLDIREVRRALRAAGIADLSDQTAVIGTEGSVDFRHVVTIWDRCRQLGFGDIGLETGNQQ